jgi:hypothetical protein
MLAIDRVLPINRDPHFNRINSRERGSAVSKYEILFSPASIVKDDGCVNIALYYQIDKIPFCLRTTSICDVKLDSGTFQINS